MNRFLVIILLFPFLLAGQSSTIDSLKMALKKAKDDTARIILLNEISAACNVEELINYADASSNICKQHLSKESSAYLKYFYKKYYSWALNNIGFVYHSNGEIKNALSYFNDALQIQREIKDSVGIASSLNNLAYILESQGDIYSALNFHHESLKINEIRKDSMLIATSLNNIGIIYRNQSETKKAYDYFKRASNIQIRVNDQEGLISSLNNLGAVYLSMDSLQKSFASYDEPLKISQQTNDQDGVATALNNLGMLHKRQKNYPLALKYLLQAYQVEKAVDDQSGMINTLNNIARVHFLQGNRSEAYAILNKNIVSAKQFGYPEYIRDGASLLKELLKQQGKYKEALEMYELEIQMKDSVSNNKTKNASIKKQFQYEYEKKAAADSVKHAEEQKVKNALLTAQQAQLKQEKTQRLALYGGLVLVIAFSGFVFNRFKITKKQKAIIEQQKTIVDAAYFQLEEKNREVMDSIHYAKRIQTALMPNEKYIDKTLNRLNKE